jgi:hypothetical protein
MPFVAVILIVLLVSHYFNNMADLPLFSHNNIRYFQLVSRGLTISAAAIYATEFLMMHELPE